MPVIPPQSPPVIYEHRPAPQRSTTVPYFEAKDSPALNIKKVQRLTTHITNNAKIPVALRQDWNSGSISPKQLVGSLLEHNELITISEAPHGIINARDFVVKNLASFKDRGVGTVYIEQIDEKNQFLVDLYMNAKFGSLEEEKAFKKLDKHITSRFSSNRSSVPYSSIVREAKRLGINVRGIDSDKGQLSFSQTRQGFYGPFGEDYIRGATDFFDIQKLTRGGPSNNEWERAISFHRLRNSNAGKGIIFCGAGHNGVYNAPTVTFLSKGEKFRRINEQVEKKIKPDFLIYETNN